MFSGAYCYANGREAWSVWHDNQRGRYDLSTRGTLPAEFAPIKMRLNAKQDDNDRAAGNVDYIFDVPVELAAELTGYRHDRRLDPVANDPEQTSRCFGLGAKFKNSAPESRPTIPAV
jgi:hypothetical protein